MNREKMSRVEKGRIGENFLVEWCEKEGVEYERIKERYGDYLVNGHTVDVKYCPGRKNPRGGGVSWGFSFCHGGVKQEVDFFFCVADNTEDGRVVFVIPRNSTPYSSFSFTENSMNSKKNKKHKNAFGFLLDYKGGGVDDSIIVTGKRGRHTWKHELMEKLENLLGENKEESLVTARAIINGMMRHIKHGTTLSRERSEEMNKEKRKRGGKR